MKALRDIMLNDTALTYTAKIYLFIDLVLGVGHSG